MKSLKIFSAPSFSASWKILSSPLTAILSNARPSRNGSPEAIIPTP